METLWQIMNWVTANSHDAVSVAFMAAIVTLFIGIGTLSVSLVIGWRQGTASGRAARAALVSANATMMSSRAAGDRAVAAMRLQWIDLLRKTLSEYHSILVTAQSPISDIDKRRVSDLGTQLDLMLNLEELEQKRLWEVADRLFYSKDLDERIGMDKELMEAGRAVLKAEWRKIKSETKGDLAKPAHLKKAWFKRAK